MKTADKPRPNVRQIADAIAAEMLGITSIDPDPKIFGCSALIEAGEFGVLRCDGDQGQLISLRTADRGTKLIISGELPGAPLRKYGEEKDLRTTIYCAIAKSPQTIAGDIRRRLLPGFLEAHRILSERQAANRSYEEQSEHSLQRVADAVGTGIKQHCVRYVKAGPWDQGFGYGRITGHGTKVRMELEYVPAEIAAAMCTVWREMTKS